MKVFLKRTSLAFVTFTTGVSLMAMPSKISLIAEITPSHLLQTDEEPLEEFLSEEDLDISSDIIAENDETSSLKEIDDAQDSEMILDNDDEAEPYLNEHELSDEQSPSSSDDGFPTLYDPNMNYGTGSPKPKPAPASTKKRSLVVFVASTIIAAIAMLTTAHNGGKTPAPGTPKCPS